MDLRITLRLKSDDSHKFLDEFLQNMRKHNDIFKIEHLYQFDSSLI